METSSTVTRDPQSKNSKEFPCPHCPETFNKYFNLKRHIERFHESASEVPVGDLAPVVRKVDNAIHRINHYPVDSVVCFVNTYPLDSDLSGG